MSGEKEGRKSSRRSNDAPRNLRGRSPSPAPYGRRRQRGCRFPKELKKKKVSRNQTLLPIGLWRRFLKIPGDSRVNCKVKTSLGVHEAIALVQVKPSFGISTRWKGIDVILLNVLYYTFFFFFSFFLLKANLTNKYGGPTWLDFFSFLLLFFYFYLYSIKHKNVILFNILMVGNFGNSIIMALYYFSPNYSTSFLF